MLTPTSRTRPLMPNGCGQRIDQALGDPARGREIGRARQQHRELVAAQPRHGVDLAQRPLQPRTDLGQQQVADVMAERVVDVLEAVEVEQQHRHRHARRAWRR